MKQMTKSNWLVLAGLLLALPAAYFFSINILNEMGISGPYKAAEPVFARWGSKQPLGWNINLLILLGPVVGFLLAIFQVLKIKWDFGKENFQFHFTVQKKWFPILVAALSSSLLAILFLYMLGENCNC
jgi:hypothetical protein